MMVEGGEDLTGTETGLSRRSLLGLALALVLSFGANGARAQDLASDETVLFLPGCARPLGNGGMAVRVQAWVFEFEQRPGVRTAFATYAGIGLDGMPEGNRAIFAARSRYFLTGSERGKVLRLSFSDTIRSDIFLPPTDRPALTEAVFDLPDARDEPRRVCRRLISFSYAAMGSVSRAA